MALPILRNRLAVLDSGPALLGPTPRMRGRKLMARRERWFAKHPLCVHCETAGRVALATELDHRTPLHQGGPDTDDNLQGLCSECHKAKTAADMDAKPRSAIGLDGCPTDPGHHWQRG